METYNDLKSAILDINQDLRLVIRKAESIDGVSHDPLEAWKATTNTVHRQLGEEMIRVAVVGSIKSGKSTLVNALFGGDYVKRGAGVVTSIVTKIRPGTSMKAKLEFKTWDDVNADMSQALILFSALPRESDDGQFDINREEDRVRLQKDVSGLNAGRLISEDARDPNSVLILEYLKGYERIKDLVSFEPKTHVFEEGEFYRQKEFVGEESLSVYLKDIVLTLVPPEGFGENLEIADCQGSDSPNPLHLTMIQDYLLSAHLIIYVLSSRTGLRQSDIKFLNIIKKMGLLKNIFFVVNCDLSEHESLTGMTKLVERARDELGMILPDPEVFAFSALHNLFNDLALQTNLERISIMASGMQDWAQINHDLFSRDAGEIKAAFAEMEKRRKTSDQVTSVIKDTLDGTTEKLKRELRNDVDRFFDPQYGDTVQGIIKFVESYNISARDYEKDLETSGFLSTLYRIFQNIREATNRYMAETTNPKLVDFVRIGEEKIKEIAEQVSGPYSLMIQDAVDQHRRTAEKLGIRLQQRSYTPPKSPEIDLVKSDARLSIPPLVTAMRYSGRIKTEAILRLGIYNTMEAVKKLLRKRVGGDLDSAIRSLEDSVRRIKEQLRESITAHLMDYRENLKYQYLFKLVDAMSSSLYESLVDRMRAFTGSASDMSGLMENQRQARDQIVKEFVSLATSVSAVLDKVGEAERLLEGQNSFQHSG
ncbi:MAG: dynamin family protein [Deltaproteobacteria bacterium]|nr:dynamin family protein [Deltaproteobacteria bacterium]